MRVWTRRTAIASLVSSLGTTAVGDYDTDAIQDADILNAIAQIDNAEAPDEDRTLMICSDAYNSLLTNSKFVDYNKTGQPRVITGVIGEIYGILVVKSNNVYKSGNNVSNVLFQKEAFALAVQKAPSVTISFENIYQGTAIVVTTLYGVKVYRDDHGVEIKS